MAAAAGDAAGAAAGLSAAGAASASTSLCLSGVSTSRSCVGWRREETYDLPFVRSSPPAVRVVVGEFLGLRNAHMPNVRRTRCRVPCCTCCRCRAPRQVPVTEPVERCADHGSIQAPEKDGTGENLDEFRLLSGRREPFLLEEFREILHLELVELSRGRHNCDADSWATCVEVGLLSRRQQRRRTSSTCRYRASHTQTNRHTRTQAETERLRTRLHVPLPVASRFDDAFVGRACKKRLEIKGK